MRVIWPARVSTNCAMCAVSSWPRRKGPTSSAISPLHVSRTIASASCAIAECTSKRCHASRRAPADEFASRPSSGVRAPAGLTRLGRSMISASGENSGRNASPWAPDSSAACRARARVTGDGCILQPELCNHGCQYRLTRMPTVDLHALDLATLAWLAGSAANEHLLQQLRAAGHPDIRIAHGYVFQHLLGGA